MLRVLRVGEYADTGGDESAGEELGGGAFAVESGGCVGAAAGDIGEGGIVGRFGEGRPGETKAG